MSAAKLRQSIMQQTELEPLPHAVLGQESASPLEELPSSECPSDLPAGPLTDKPLDLPIPQPASPERVTPTGQQDGTMADEPVSALDILSCRRPLSVQLYEL